MPQGYLHFLFSLRDEYMYVAESMGEGWDFLEKPELAPDTIDLVEHAKSMLEILEDDGETNDEDE